MKHKTWNHKTTVREEDKAPCFGLGNYFFGYVVSRPDLQEMLKDVP